MPTGATTSLDEEAVKTAVRGLLAGVTGIGKVGDRVGDRATWLERRFPKQAYSEVTVPGIAERLEASGEIEERATVRIDLWMSWSHDDRTEPTFAALLRAVKAVLRAARYLGGDEGEIVDDTELPQTLNELAPFGEEEKVVLCHHGVLTFEAVWEFRWVWS